jgi:hypothetical protein
MIRAFNIMCPYEKEFPKPNGDEKGISSMYGETWFEGKTHQFSKFY